MVKISGQKVVKLVVKRVVKRVVKISGQKGQWLVAGQPTPAVPYGRRAGRWTEFMVKKRAFDQRNGQKGPLIKSTVQSL